MKSIKRPLATFGGAALLAVSLTACGGGAPTNASVEDFCGLDEEFDGAFADVAEEDYDAFEEAAHGLADEMNDVGTPEDIPEDAREGFEIIAEALGDIDGGEVEDAANEAQEAIEAGEEFDEDAMVGDMFGIDEDDMAKFDALEEYSDETCD